MVMEMRMSFRLPRSSDAGLAGLERDIAAEKAATLGRAGDLVALRLKALADAAEGGRSAALHAAAEAVHAYIIQRELLGLRNHADAIRDYGIPRAVLVRLGAR
jgi:hypothetical protein